MDAVKVRLAVIRIVSRSVGAAGSGPVSDRRFATDPDRRSLATRYGQISITRAVVGRLWKRTLHQDVSVGALELSSDTQIERPAGERRPHIGNRIAARTGAGAQKPVVVRLTHVSEVDGVEKNRDRGDA